MNTNQPLFSLLGITYGGDEIPPLACRICAAAWCWHASQLPGLTDRRGGTHVLQQPEMPTHTHAMAGSSATATVDAQVANSIPAAAKAATYSTTVNSSLVSGSATTGGSQPYPNQPPYLATDYCTALTGIFPSRG